MVQLGSSFFSRLWGGFVLGSGLGAFSYDYLSSLSASLLILNHIKTSADL